MENRKVHFYLTDLKIPKNVIVMILSVRYDKLLLYADHKKCFDKSQKCPIKIPLPSNEEQLNFLNEKLSWLGSRKGYRASNFYEFEYWIDDYPKELIEE